MDTNLTEKQLGGSDKAQWAVFLPAWSSFYSTIIGRQRVYGDVPSSRLPTAMTDVEDLNFLEPGPNRAFQYKWGLYSAGHANLDMNKQPPREDLWRNRKRDGSTWVIGDSGGFQIGKGVWEGDWKDPSCPKAQAKRSAVLSWMDGLMDYGMILDIPAWVARSPKGQKATGISTYQDAVNATRINNDYFMKNRTGSCKFLNVLQGETHTEAEDWYQQMKDYCDPKKHSEPFNGWAMGGQNMCDVHLVLKRLVALRFDGLLEKGHHDWMHFLGTSRLEWAVMLTDIQTAIRKYHNENFTISFDCASPFLSNANGLIYTTTRLGHKGKWSYKMEPSIDDRNYHSDTRPLKDALLQDKIVAGFEETPVSKLLTAKDICTYHPGAVNKFGKVSKTSWDSFSYYLQMAHNAYTHINAVQRANQAYAAGDIPQMLMDDRFDIIMFKDIVEQIFSTSDRSKAEAAVAEWDKFYLRVIGSRGAVGKKTINAKTSFNEMFEVDEEQFDQNEFDECKLEELENDKD